DMDVDVELVMAVADGGDGVLELSGLAMSFTEREVFVHLQVEFDENAAVLLESSDVVDGMAHALGNRTNGFEKVFVVRGARFGVDDNIGRSDLADALFDGVGEDMDLFQAGGARNGDGRVDEVAIAG